MTAVAHNPSAEVDYRDLLISSIKSTLASFEHTDELIDWAYGRAETVGDVDIALVAPLLAPARRAAAALTALEDAALQIEAVSPRRETVFDAFRRSTGDHPGFRKTRGPRE